IKPEMNIPLKLGLYALKDKQGHVNIALPVSGRSDSPEFSYRRIVMKALGNVLLKVISAPFSFMFGSGSRIDLIDIDALQQAFTSEQYAKFDRLADMLAQKPEMKLSLTQRVDYDKALIREAEMILKASYYNSMQSDSTHRLNMLDFEAIAAMPVKSNQLSAYADSLLDVRGIDRKSMKTTEKALALYGDLAAKYLDRTLQRRDSSLVRYMSTAHPSVAGSSFRVVSQSDSLRRSHRGADRYVITVEVDGESVDVASDDAVAETAPDGGSAADSLATERAEYLPEA
ncbi:MAG: AsmA family protein, partial [Alistipes sp.]|nr:AsmA family protein [Alistipes sp.]